MTYYIFPGIRCRKLFDIIEENFEVTHEQLMQRSRKRHIIEARQFACWVMRIKLHMKLQDIADYFNQDHATVIHCCKKIEELKSVDKNFRNKLNAINLGGVSL